MPAITGFTFRIRIIQLFKYWQCLLRLYLAQSPDCNISPGPGRIGCVKKPGDQGILGIALVFLLCNFNSLLHSMPDRQHENGESRDQQDYKTGRNENYFPLHHFLILLIPRAGILLISQKYTMPTVIPFHEGHKSTLRYEPYLFFPGYSFGGYLLYICSGTACHQSVRC